MIGSWTWYICKLRNISLLFINNRLKKSRKLLMEFLLRINEKKYFQREHFVLIYNLAEAMTRIWNLRKLSFFKKKKLLVLNSLLITFAREQIERSLSAMMCGLNIQLLFNVHWYSKGNKNTRLDRYQVLGFNNDRVPKQTCNRLCKCVW